MNSSTPSIPQILDPSQGPAPTIRFSLHAMLAELERDHATGSFAMEKLNQSEIIKLFEINRKNREKKA